MGRRICVSLGLCRQVPGADDWVILPSTYRTRRRRVLLRMHSFHWQQNGKRRSAIPWDMSR